MNALTSAMAPTNTLLGNPAAIKKAFDTGGRSLLRGVRSLVDDVRHNGGLPQSTDRSAFAVGRDLGVSKGAVVYRDDVIELIQYSPTTPQVRERPLLIVPPPIGRYYFLDLQPGRSFVEYAVAQGLQVFMISWRNPTRKQSDWNLDTYAERVRRAIGVARAITGSPDVNTMGFCAGGIITTTLLNHLAATSTPACTARRSRSRCSTSSRRRRSGRSPARALLGLARRVSKALGVLPAKGLGSVFSWMRPDDLVFNYLVNQWLMGEAPPAFDVLAWNADGTNLPAALHEQFLEIFQDNSLVRPGALTVLGTPVDLANITVPTFVAGAATDHITPWTGRYRTTQLMSGPSTFVLSHSGHIQSLVNPPGNPKASHWVGGDAGRTPRTGRRPPSARRQLVGVLVAVGGRAVGRPRGCAGVAGQRRAPAAGGGAGLVRGRPGARGSVGSTTRTGRRRGDGFGVEDVGGDAWCGRYRLQRVQGRPASPVRQRTSSTRVALAVPPPSHIVCRP